MKPLMLAVVFMLLSAGSLYAQPRPDAGAWKKMNLSEEQKTALKDIRTETQKKMIDIRATLQKKRIDMKDMMQDESADRAAFEKLSREIADLQVQQKLALFDADQKVMKQLDPEQQKQWKEMKGKRMEMRMKDARGKREHMRGPEGRSSRGRRGMMQERTEDAPPPEDD